MVVCLLQPRRAVFLVRVGLSSSTVLGLGRCARLVGSGHLCSPCPSPTPSRCPSSQVIPSP